MIASARRSADVTGLPSCFELTSQPRSYSSITAGPAASTHLGQKQRDFVARAGIEDEGIRIPDNRAQAVAPSFVAFICKLSSRPWSELAREGSNAAKGDTVSISAKAPISNPGSTNLMMASLTPLDLAALLCSRVCHDVISPVGAIVNGLEVLDGEQDEEMRAIAMELIKKSAISASARLQFCRLAFGAAGSFGALIDTGDAEKAARDIFANGRTVLQWSAARRMASRNSVKLLLNLCLIAASAIPRGGVIVVDISGEDDAITLRVERQGRQRPTVAQRGRHPVQRPRQGNDRRAFHTTLLHRAAGPRVCGGCSTKCHLRPKS